MRSNELKDRLFAESQNYGLHEDVRALLREAGEALISPSDPISHEPPPDDIGPYPHGWDNYRDSSCLIADLAGAEPVFRSENEAD